jgi:hypothetical protein
MLICGVAASIRNSHFRAIVCRKICRYFSTSSTSGTSTWSCQTTDLPGGDIEIADLKLPSGMNRAMAQARPERY